MSHKKFYTLFFLVSFFFSNAFAASSLWHKNESNGAEVRLISSFFFDANGQGKLIAGLHFKIKKGWKIYGADSVGIGMPPSITNESSEVVKDIKIIWPEAVKKQEEIGDEIIKYDVYENEVILPIEVNLQDYSQETELKFSVDYGLCSDICIPASEKFDLKVDKEQDFEVLNSIQKFYPNRISNLEEQGFQNSSKSVVNIALISAVFFAIIGGAILNVMPCVLPVLSIKLLSILNNSRATRKRIKFAFLATFLGIIFCFFIFALIAVFLKVTGNSLGWGLQFQNPYFLLFLILVLVLLTGNLLGVFEINLSVFVANLLNKKISNSTKGKNIFIPNFLSGILAVLLATPCSAPFLGSAISFALSANILAIFAIFLSIGFGFALPYVVLFFTPRAVYFLPRPGKWMYAVKKLMALFLVITVLWLTYVLNHNIGLMPAVIVTSLSILLLAAIEIRSKILKFLTIFFIIATSLAIPSIGAGQMAKKRLLVSNKNWIKFDEKLLYQMVSEGKVVVVDVTADWCLTCKLNKKRVLEDPKVVKKLTQNNVVAMRGDITKPDKEIVDFLKSHNRFAIPFNVVYGSNAKNGIVTKEILDKKELLKIIDEASQ
ncbi:MAG: hypothetical protein FJ368_00450 [Pelagibacterales bacterium]|nr:hypothetical protein [Pelagibacterales bacterium]